MSSSHVNSGLPTFSLPSSLVSKAALVILLAVSGDSDYVHDDTFSEMEEGMEEIPKEILNAIDCFNVESDEEFIGFE
jgi:hypothetical protein